VRVAFARFGEVALQAFEIGAVEGKADTGFKRFKGFMRFMRFTCWLSCGPFC